jgi:hypothetical protein
MKVTALPAGGLPTTLVDHDYSFDAQLAYPIDPAITLQPGDAVSVECSYFNPTGTTVHFGDSTTDEMCFSGLYWYPTRHSSFLCAG